MKKEENKKEKIKKIEDLENQDIINLIIDGFRKTILHYGLWFCETLHQIGLENTLLIEREVWKKDFSIIMKRLSKVIGFEIDENGVPMYLKTQSKEKLLDILQAVSINWLATDGVWFLEVEKQYEMYTAKRCNDTCWARFSPLEAMIIKEMLKLPEKGGIKALKQALNLRSYAKINKQSFKEIDENTLIFYMNECRVQCARKRKGLPDYPCKSGGIIEYKTFASTIDSRIKTECIACPPDKHPEEWYCCWKFYIEEK